MSADHDPTEFVDGDFEAHKAPGSAASSMFGQGQRAPTREEVDSRVSEAQQQLAEKRRELEELERQRAALEETRRRQSEFQMGRQELIHNLTRGLGLLEEAEFNARRDSEQMAKVLADLRDALSKTEAIREETWTKDNFQVELTRALTTLENARMEWNAARLKFSLLAGPVQQADGAPPAAGASAPLLPAALGFRQACLLGLALTWPLALLGLAALLVAVLLRR